MKRAFLFLAFAAAAAASDQAGLTPRMGATDYPAHSENNGAALGATLLNANQVHGGFSTDLNRGYVVVEVAVYPKDGAPVDLGPGDFTLRIEGADTRSRASSPKVIAAALQRASAKDRDVDLYPAIGVGYESGPRVYDPATGGTRGGGWNTSAGVGVGVGGSGQQKPASTEADRRTMELELADKQLPEKIITGPVAGYLYFPLLSKKKNVSYVLEFHNPSGRLVLPLEPPRTK